MYTVVSWNQTGRVIRCGVSLGEAYRLVRALGRGAIFRSSNMDRALYAHPIYPRRAA